MAGHVAPEAARRRAHRRGGRWRHGVFDIEKRRIDMEVSDTDIKARLAKWKAPEPRYKRGVSPIRFAGFLRVGKARDVCEAVTRAEITSR